MSINELDANDLFMQLTGETGRVLIAQHLYDARELTGEVGGNELSQMFEDITGDPSPAGSVHIDRAALTEHRVGVRMAALLLSPFRDVILRIAEYHPEYFRA
jgi:hypothetical protein